MANEVPELDRVTLVFAKQSSLDATPDMIVSVFGPGQISDSDLRSLARELADDGYYAIRGHHRETNWGGFAEVFDGTVAFASAVAMDILKNIIVAKVEQFIRPLTELPSEDEALRAAEQSIVLSHEGISRADLRLIGAGYDADARTRTVTLQHGSTVWESTVRLSPGGLPFVVTQRRTWDHS